MSTARDVSRNRRTTLRSGADGAGSGCGISKRPFRPKGTFPAPVWRFTYLATPAGARGYPQRDHHPKRDESSDHAVQWVNAMRARVVSGEGRILNNGGGGRFVLRKLAPSALGLRGRRRSFLNVRIHPGVHLPKHVEHGFAGSVSMRLEGKKDEPDGSPMALDRTVEAFALDRECA